MKEQIEKAIKAVITTLYPEHKDVFFSVEYAPKGIDADFASNAAMVLAKKSGEKPMEVAEEIVKGYQGNGDKGCQVEAANPGFINFTLPPSHWQEELKMILRQKDKYGGSTANKGKKARIEYVSANPTGPIHIGNARGGPYGEVICKVLEATGYKIMREYIHNDVGGQVEKLGKTIWHWYLKQQGKDSEFPEGGYQGEYPLEIAKAAPKGMDMEKLTMFAMDYIFAENLQTMEKMGIKFDQIVKESELQSSGQVSKAVEEVKKQGFAREHEGALWFAPNDVFLKDREAVIVKSDGNFTYFASDIAYHKEKFQSGYDLVMDVFGSNHHGHVPKLRALTKVFGFDPHKFKVLLYQYVRVKMGDQVVKMAKRAGNFVTAKEVLEMVGKDSMIFFLLSTAVNTHMDFDLELAKDTSEKNPVYKVQYAHARINSIIAKAHNPALPPLSLRGGEEGLLDSQEELGLIRELAKFPELVTDISETYAVHHLPHYLLGLAEKFHSFYEKVRVISEDEKQTAARLVLVKGAQIVLANGLRLMGITP